MHPNFTDEGTEAQERLHFLKTYSNKDLQSSDFKTFAFLFLTHTLGRRVLASRLGRPGAWLGTNQALLVSGHRASELERG